MRTDAISDIDVYERPSPELVAFIWDNYSEEAALERWARYGRWSLAKMANAGRVSARAKVGVILRGNARRTTVEQEDAAVEAALRLGGLSRAAAEVGIGVESLRRILRERGVEPPRPDRTEVARRAAATKRERAAA